jgi:hypothetical protein
MGAEALRASAAARLRASGRLSSQINTPADRLIAIRRRLLVRVRLGRERQFGDPLAHVDRDAREIRVWSVAQQRCA